ncbi:MAG: hypothetical protein M1564_00725 [Candidatus Marsarchaeota archaeon]|nr:hypothetical protein [Candidatus Marsarchaeota archaeon]MCL5430808.1 hypothetical protein [Candidatus Marsarchaeota archaeon]
MVNYHIVFFSMLLSIALLGVSHAGTQSPQCGIYINQSNEYVSLANGACPSYFVSFAPGTSYSKAVCSSQNPTISSVVFGQSTYNDTLANCTFSGATITSMNGSYDNILSPSGSYSFAFQSNNSNVALGYYFTFVPRNSSGVIGYQGFASVVPYSLDQIGGGQINSQGDNLSSIITLARKSNYTLPRFGYYAPTNSTGNITFALEAEQVGKYGNISYNPYWLVDPFWGHDILTFRKFNITADYRYTPTFIAPYHEEEDIQLPDNTNVYWNFTIRTYSNPPSDYLKFVSGYQVDPNNTVMHIAYNVSNGTIRYDRGVQKPGVHEFIGVLKAPSIGEQDNSTTDTYSVGISYCTYQMPGITIPGYYTFSRSGIYRLRTFWPTNDLCPVALQIQDHNTVINCGGGSINSTNISIMLQGSNYVELDNCRLYGNAIQASYSRNIYLNNSVVAANNDSNIALNLSNSSLFLNNDSFIGYARPSLLRNSTVVNKSITVIAPSVTTTIKQMPVNRTVYAFSQAEPTSSRTYYITLAFVIIAVMAYLAYSAAARRISRG